MTAIEMIPRMLLEDTAHCEYGVGGFFFDLSRQLQEDCVRVTKGQGFAMLLRGSHSDGLKGGRQEGGR